MIIDKNRACHGLSEEPVEFIRTGPSIRRADETHCSGRSSNTPALPVVLFSQNPRDCAVVSCVGLPIIQHKTTAAFLAVLISGAAFAVTLLRGVSRVERYAEKRFN